MAEARTVAKHSDVIVLCLGLDADIEGEENDEYSLAVAAIKAGWNFPGASSTCWSKWWMLRRGSR